MNDIIQQAIEDGDRDELRAILAEICAVTGMGFAAIARVTETQWITCQVDDRIEFGLDPGDELLVKQTICDEIRDSGETVVFDDASGDIKWSRHPVPVLYGFKSYCSIPVYLDDGSFYGTLCAIDPEPRSVANEAIVAVLTTMRRRSAEFCRRVPRSADCEPASASAAARRAMRPWRMPPVPPPKLRSGWRPIAAGSATTII